MKERPRVQRDISWLDFNYRVLQEAKDERVPLFERIKFMAIYSSNLDEFFRVRVANHRNLMRAGKKARKELEFDPAEILGKIQNIVNKQQEEVSYLFEYIIKPELLKVGIRIVDKEKWNEQQLQFIDNYFEDNLLPFVQPVLLLKNKIKPFLNNGALYLTLVMRDKEKKKALSHAIVKVPSEVVGRFVVLPDDNEMHSVILLDDIVRHSIELMFPGYDILESYSIKLTRDADLYIDDEFTGNLLGKIKKALTKRSIGPASRLIYDRKMPNDTLALLLETFDITELDLFPEGRYHNNSNFFQFPKFGMHHLSDQVLTPIPIADLETPNQIFNALDKEDRFIHMPYHSYEGVINFFESAANDPNVTHIKIVQYRVAKVSRIMEALIKAVKKGKQVSAFIEVKARFDEEANLSWGERLEKAGIRVIYSIPGIKVHAKLALVFRKEQHNSKVYAYLSTGNFHEGTVAIYSDVGLFTTDERITLECVRLFNYLELQQGNSLEFEHLAVGKFNLNDKLRSLVNYEIEQAKKGKKAHIILKMNSLQDDEMVEMLYTASQAGVKIDLIIRGICCVIGKVPGISDNINVISIVDRYLEHARIFYFKHGDKPKYYISSADWMYRNLHRRIEIITPIYNEQIQLILMELLQLQLDDNIKSRSLNYKKINTYNTTKKAMISHSQLDTYYFIKRMTENLWSVDSEEDN